MGLKFILKRSTRVNQKTNQRRNKDIFLESDFWYFCEKILKKALIKKQKILQRMKNFFCILFGAFLLKNVKK